MRTHPYSVFVNGQCYKNCFQWKVYWFGSQTLIYPTALNVYKSVTNVWTNSVCIIVLAYVFTLKGSNSQIVKIYIVVIQYTWLWGWHSRICAPKWQGSPGVLCRPRPLFIWSTVKPWRHRNISFSSQSFLHTEIYTFDYFNTVIFFVIVKNVSEVDLQPPYLLIYNICKV